MVTTDHDRIDCFFIWWYVFFIKNILHDENNIQLRKKFKKIVDFIFLFFLLSETVDIWNWGDNSDTSHSVFLCVHHLFAKETTP